MFIVGIICIIVGFIGIALPALPGILLVLVGCILIAWNGGFQDVGLLPLVSITLIALLSQVAEIFTTKYGVEKVGASRRAVFGALLGLFAGFFFAPIGIVVGPFLGAMLGEYSVQADFNQATKAGLGAWLGLFASIIIKYILAFAMVGILISALIW
jgi:uncharacterized protein